MVIYNIIIYIVQPIIWIQLLWRNKKSTLHYKDILERYGLYFKTQIKPLGIVLHTVSVGETVSIAPLICKIKQCYPNTVITLTVMTESGLEIARRFQSKYHIQYMYLPYDLPYSMKRFIKMVQPKLMIIMETELWPNLINTLYQYKIPLIIANARLSFNSFNKYKKIKYFLNYIMQRITIVAVQYETDANRFLRLGLKKNQLHIIGNIKFDMIIPKKIFKKKFTLHNTKFKKRLTWIAGSTHAEEETLLLQAHKTLLTTFPDLLMIFAPRHLERLTNIIKITKKLKLSYNIVKNNNFILTDHNNVQVIINNTIGNLVTLYGFSDIAFIGGSLITSHHGGHNPLEPAAYAIPLIMGPYTSNFNNICFKLYQSNGLIYVTDSTSLIHIISVLLKNQPLREYYGSCAFQVLEQNRGTLEKLMPIIHTYL